MLLRAIFTKHKIIISLLSVIDALLLFLILSYSPPVLAINNTTLPFEDDFLNLDADNKWNTFSLEGTGFQDNTQVLAYAKNAAGKKVGPTVALPKVKTPQGEVKVKIPSGAFPPDVDGISVVTRNPGTASPPITTTPTPSDLLPPVISDLSKSVTANSATITWKTDELASGVVDYGLTSSYGRNAVEPGAARDHRIVLSDLSPDTEYHFRIMNRDAAGNVVFSSDQTFKTLQGASTEFSISNVSISDVTASSVKISWGSNQEASSNIQYGLTTSYGSTATDPTIQMLVKNHSLSLSGLSSSTLYHFKVSSVNVQGVSRSSNDYTFVTLRQGNNPTDEPVISDFTISDKTTTSIKIIWRTNNKEADTKLAYGVTMARDLTFSDPSQAKYHVVLLSNLSPDTTYYFRASSTDILGKSDSEEGEFETAGFGDIPVIDNIKVQNITETSAKVTWTTNRSASSIVYYSLLPLTPAPPADQIFKTIYPGLWPDHTVGLTGLKPGKTYHFQVESGDEEGVAKSSEQTFTVLGTPDDIPPSAITDLKIEKTTATTAELSFTAPGDDNTVGTAKLYELRYSKEAITEVNFKNASLAATYPPKVAGTKEAATVYDLTPETIYYFAIKVIDKGENISALSNVVNGATKALSLRISNVQVSETAPSAQTPSRSTAAFSETKTAASSSSGTTGASNVKVSGNSSSSMRYTTWNTDKQATSQVIFGKEKDKYDSETTLSAPLVVSHNVKVNFVSSLKGNTPVKRALPTTSGILPWSRIITSALAQEEDIEASEVKTKTKSDSQDNENQISPNPTAVTYHLRVKSTAGEDIAYGPDMEVTIQSSQGGGGGSEDKKPEEPKKPEEKICPEGYKVKDGAVVQKDEATEEPIEKPKENVPDWCEKISGGDKQEGEKKDDKKGGNVANYVGGGLANTCVKGLILGPGEEAVVWTPGKGMQVEEWKVAPDGFGSLVEKDGGYVYQAPSHEEIEKSGRKDVTALFKVSAGKGAAQEPKEPSSGDSSKGGSSGAQTAPTSQSFSCRITLASASSLYDAQCPKIEVLGNGGQTYFSLNIKDKESQNPHRLGSSVRAYVGTPASEEYKDVGEAEKEVNSGLKEGVVNKERANGFKYVSRKDAALYFKEEKSEDIVPLTVYFSSGNSRTVECKVTVKHQKTELKDAIKCDPNPLVISQDKDKDSAEIKIVKKDLGLTISDVQLLSDEKKPERDIAVENSDPDYSLGDWGFTVTAKGDRKVDYTEPLKFEVFLEPATQNSGAGKSSEMKPGILYAAAKGDDNGKGGAANQLGTLGEAVSAGVSKQPAGNQGGKEEQPPAKEPAAKENKQESFSTTIQCGLRIEKRREAENVVECKESILNPYSFIGKRWRGELNLKVKEGFNIEELQGVGFFVATAGTQDAPYYYADIEDEFPSGSLPLTVKIKSKKNGYIFTNNLQCSFKEPTEIKIDNDRSYFEVNDYSIHIYIVLESDSASVQKIVVDGLPSPDEPRFDYVSGNPFCKGRPPTIVCEQMASPFLQPNEVTGFTVDYDPYILDQEVGQKPARTIISAPPSIGVTFFGVNGKSNKKTTLRRKSISSVAPPSLPSRSSLRLLAPPPPPPCEDEFGC